MRKLIAALFLVVLPLVALADGTVTVPVSNPATTWKIAGTATYSGALGGAPTITFQIAYFDAAGAWSRTDVVQLTDPTEMNSFTGQLLSAVTGETGTNTQKFRMRATKWLVDNNKIANVTPE